jgi:predicted PurR-regulated permease PerM
VLSTLGFFVLVVVCLSQGKQVLIPLAMAGLLAFILIPLVEAIERRGTGRVPAVVISVSLACALIVGAGWVLVVELGQLAGELPKHTGTITKKIESLRTTGPSVVGRLEETWNQTSAALQRTLRPGNEEGKLPPQEVTITSPGFSWLPGILGPLVELLTTGILIIFLVVFALIRREDLRNRLLRVVGGGRLTVTTRALDEAMHRISSFLLMQLTVNAIFAALFGLGLAVIGVPYAFLWGVLSGALRFAPYVGSWIGLAFPLLFSVAVSSGWSQPGIVFVYFIVLELFTANVLEPLLFSHSTGVSPIALIVAVIFWTWLWGPLGLVLSTPLTTCLYVLGRYVPQMEFLGVLLGAEPALEPQIVYYQRLLARDQDEASDLVEEQIKSTPLENVYDEIFLPALIMAKRDRERGDLSPADEQYIRQATFDILQSTVLPQLQFNLIAAQGVAPAKADGTSALPKALIFGCPAQDETDELALQMLRQLLEPARGELEVGSAKMLTSEVVAWVAARQPALVCIGSVPPGGLAQARYLVLRLRSQYPDLKIAVGRWGQAENVERARDRLREAGADFVATRLLASQEQIVPFISVAAPPIEGARGEARWAREKAPS